MHITVNTEKEVNKFKIAKQTLVYGQAMKFSSAEKVGDYWNVHLNPISETRATGAIKPIIHCY